MKKVVVLSLLVLVFALMITNHALAQIATTEEIQALNTADMAIKGAKVKYMKELDLLVFEVDVEGTAGATAPKARGQLNGAPVLGYVFPTTLKSEDVGFSATEGIVALAVTSHPDFDDSPLWDENNDRKYDNDGLVFHTHWVVLEKDERVKGGLAVKHAHDESIIQPPTSPKMPMYMDSPGYSVVKDGKKLRVLVPAQRVSHQKQFKFDAVACFMEVSENPEKPMLGVYEVFKVLSGDLSLPYSVK